jgi:hypothetical protein
MTDLQADLDLFSGDYAPDPGSPLANIVEAARKYDNPDYEAAAKSRWDNFFGEGSWDHPDNQNDDEFKTTRRGFLKSATREVNAALGITEDTHAD